MSAMHAGVWPPPPALPSAHPRLKRVPATTSAMSRFTPPEYAVFDTPVHVGGGIVAWVNQIEPDKPNY